MAVAGFVKVSKRQISSRPNSMGVAQWPDAYHAYNKPNGSLARQ